MSQGKITKFFNWNQDPIAKYNARIDKDAKKFAKLDAAGKRVMIAKDILLQLDAKKLVAEQGRYVSISSLYEFDDTQDIKANYSKIKECPVCALGACLMATTKFNNHLKFGDIGPTVSYMNTSKVSFVLQELFSDEQLLLIECAFEGMITGESSYASQTFGTNLPADEFKKAYDFANKFREKYSIDAKNTSTLKMEAIMNNIIQNKGTFIP